jgi:uncharacterized protein YndB with AHSA1/START domain
VSKPTAVAVQKFNIGPGKVYDAILDPKMIGRFMFGPLLREEEIIHIENQPRVGGEFSFLVRRGKDQIDHVGRYLELARPNRIVFTWAIKSDEGGSVVFIDITPTAEGCTLTLTHEMPPQWADFADLSRAAWEKMLGVLATLL